MATQMVDLQDESIDVKKLLRDIAATGTEILILDKGIPLARVLPVKNRIPGLFEDKGSFWMADDFDAPLSDDYWLGRDENSG